MNKPVRIVGPPLAEAPILIQLGSGKAEAAFYEAIAATSRVVERAPSQAAMLQALRSRRIGAVITDVASVADLGIRSASRDGKVRVAFAPGENGVRPRPTFAAFFEKDAPIFSIVSAAITFARMRSGAAGPQAPAQSSSQTQLRRPDANATKSPSDSEVTDLEAAKRLCALPFREAERLVLEAAIMDAGSMPKAARRLGLSPSTLYRKVESWKKRSED